MKKAAGEVVAFGIMQARLGKADDLMDLLSENLNDTLGLEGVIEAHISQSLDEPNRFFTWSRWESLKAYDDIQEEYAAHIEEQMALTDLLETTPVWGAYMIIES